MVALCGGLTLLVFAACFINTYSAPITCDAGTYVVGQPASITCNFRTNISVSQQSFNMARYPPTAEKGAIGTDVLVCHWSDANHKHDCTVTDGYEFDNVITDQVTVEITETEEAFEGLYMCFFVPSQGKDTHACDFKITFESEKAVDSTQTTPPLNEGNTLNTTLIAAVCVIVVVTIVCVMLGIFWKCFKNKTRLKEEAGYPLIDLEQKQIPEHLEGLELPKKNLEASLKKSRKPSDLMAILERETKQGLDNITRSEEDNTTPSVGDDITQSDADLQMYRLYCPLMDQTGNAELLVVDVGSTLLQISFVILQEQVIITSESYMMKTASGIQMFALIAESIKTFVCEKKLTKRSPLHAAIIFPFPCHQTSLKKARLAKWTREFCCEDVVDKDIQELLQNALQKRKTVTLQG
ncbi:uncharacterized protein [Littorina saxatilis]|uniref:uncharacterized protein n=1 Tax=Littorina saxatilis TaxID=31220 RepID=UPI0038B55762